MNVGTRVKIIAPGVFCGHSGTVARITQRRPAGPCWFWVVFDSHPWQKSGVDWSFSERELVFL